MDLKVLVFTLCLVISVNCVEKARYDNYRVYEINIENEKQLELIREIERFPDGYRFWNHVNEVNTKVELVVPPHKFAEFSEFQEKFELKSRMFIDNLQDKIDNEQPLKQRKAGVDWKSYNTYSEINAWMTGLAAEFPGKVSPFVAGVSYEGREIRGVKVNLNGGSGKRAVVLEGTMHAREWISTATTTWMLNEILRTNDPELRELSNYFDWYVIPVANPDGYEYTWTKDRAWRKTRRPSNLICFGADPNRNWDIHFNEGGSSTNPCSDLYAGKSPFSEPETLALSNFIGAIPNLSGYFAFHAYGQMLMLPYGHTKEHLDNYDQLFEIGTKAIASLKLKHGINYKLGSIAEIIYIATGSSLDWVKSVLKTNVSYAYEFRDEGRNGFTLPASQIIDNSVEVMASVVTILSEARKMGIS